MPSNGRLLRKLRKVMGAAVTLPSLVAFSSQISCGKLYCYSENGVSYTYDSGLKTLIISGRGKVVHHFWRRMGIDYHEIREIVIHQGINSISELAFSRFGNLKIVIPKSVTKIGHSAFWFCSNLEEIEIPEGVTEIGNCAFMNCKNLEKIVIPSTLKKISNGTFTKCLNLKEIKIPEGVTEIDSCAFENCESLKRVVIPFSVTDINVDAFYACWNLSEVEFLPFHLNDADMAVLQALKSHGSFKSPVVENMIRFLKPLPLRIASAFRTCYELKQIVVPDHAEISNYAFPAETKVVKKKMTPSWY